MNKNLFLALGASLLGAIMQANFDMDQQNSVSTIYSCWYSKPLHYLLTSNKWASVVAGSLANTRLSSWYVPRFVKHYNLQESDFENPLRSYKTFNEFFVRKLKPGVRSITLQENEVASPADGAVLVIEHIGESTAFPIKGVTFDLETLLKNKALAEEFHGGTAFVIRLAPWDYHRLHFPLSGVPSVHSVIHGKLESVHPFVYSCGIQPLTVNERHLTLFKTAWAGTVALIPVGALFVGAITETYTPNQFYNKGDEMAYFSFGGSTIVVLFKKDTITVFPEILERSAQGKETQVKMGQPIATINML